MFFSYFLYQQQTVKISSKYYTPENMWLLENLLRYELHHQNRKKRNKEKLKRQNEAKDQKSGKPKQTNQPSNQQPKPKPKPTPTPKQGKNGKDFDEDGIIEATCRKKEKKITIVVVID